MRPVRAIIILFLLLLLAVPVMGSTLHQGGAVNVSADLGDAPDSANTFGVGMTTYGGTPANFPSVFSVAPTGPRHHNRPLLFHLGMNISREEEADSGADGDGVNNIDPPANVADRDRFDDGVRLPVTPPPNCVEMKITYLVRVYPGAVNNDVYFNMWFDWDRSGNWGETPDCPNAPAPEWAVQNQLITLPGAPGLYVYTTPAFLPLFHVPDGDPHIWVRATISDQPSAWADGQGPAAGYKAGETEDRYYRPEMRGIHGRKWDDKNGNGQHDPGEVGLPGWTIELEDATGAVQTAVTNEEGFYWFTDVVPGDYTVREVHQQGYRQTFPPNNGVHQISYHQGETIIGLNFGNWPGDPGDRCDLTVEKRHEGQVFTFGGTGVFVIKVSNVGDGVCEGPITVIDSLPTGLSMPAGGFVVGPWNCNADAGSPQTITCTHPGPLPPGGMLPPITLTVNVGPGQQTTAVENCAVVTGQNDQTPNNNRGCDNVTIVVPDPADHCRTHWDVHIPPGATYIQIWMTIYNNSSSTQTYNLNVIDGPGLSGMGSFTTAPPGPTYTVPGNSFLNVLITVSPPPVVTTTPVAPYSVVVTNTATGNTFSCHGQVWQPGSDTWWVNGPGNNGEPQGIPEGGGGRAAGTVAVPVRFFLHNLGDQPNQMDVRFETMGEADAGRGDLNPIVLNGGPPGEPLIMDDVEVPEGSTRVIVLQVAMAEPGVGDIIMYVDEDEDGKSDSATSILVFSEARVTADFGDAPDSGNNSGNVMTTYGAVPAKFPTVSNVAPFGPVHQNAELAFYLGQGISAERQADVGFDTDGVTNIDPPNNVDDRDRFDDGVRLPKTPPDNCTEMRIAYLVNVRPGAVNRDVYFNMWFDWTRNAEWGDVPLCPNDVPAPEWAVQNQLITLPGAPGMYVYITPVFVPMFFAQGDDPHIWIRATLAEQPATSAKAEGVANGYREGETEDYYYSPEMRGIHGRKWQDKNGNGRFDPGEVGLSGWTIELEDAAGGTTSTTTNEHGFYWFVGLDQGEYTIREVHQAGFRQTFPAGGGEHTVHYVPGETIVGLNFGNWPGDPGDVCDLSVRKWHEGDAFVYGRKGAYNIKVTNVGDGVCDGPIQIVDTLPEGMKVDQPANVPFAVGGWTCIADANDPQTVTCTHPGPLPPGAMLPQITLIVEVPAAPGQSGWDGDLAINCVTVSAQGDQNPDNNTACDQVPVRVPPRDERCQSHWDVHIPPLANYIEFWMTIFNNTLSPQMYNINLVDGPGLSGMGSFTTTPPTPVTVPANSFLNVLINVSPPPVVTTPPVAPYSVVVTNLADGSVFVCGGQVWKPGSDDWWVNGPSNNGEPQGIPVGGGGGGQRATSSVKFYVHNFDVVANQMDIRFESMGEMTELRGGTNPIILNGGAPGAPVIMDDTIIPAGSTLVIDLDVSFDAPGMGDIIMYVDEDEDGSDDSASSVEVYSEAVPTAVGLGEVAVTPLGVLAALLVTLVAALTSWLLWRRSAVA